MLLTRQEFLAMVKTRIVGQLSDAGISVDAQLEEGIEKLAPHFFPIIQTEVERIRVPDAAWEELFK